MKYFVNYKVWCPQNGKTFLPTISIEIPESLYTKLLTMPDNEAIKSIHNLLQGEMVPPPEQWSENDEWSLSYKQ